VTAFSIGSCGSPIQRGVSMAEKGQLPRVADEQAPVTQGQFLSLTVAHFAAVAMITAADPSRSALSAT
jgi:hypothetical protein